MIRVGRSARETNGPERYSPIARPRDRDRPASFQAELCRGCRMRTRFYLPDHPTPGSTEQPEPRWECIVCGK